ncbi:protoheme IX farnesyltransferase [Arboricoccus pini]|uniref:Protoheme IX farnesyltransferase n=1 Tax=Arboricoccus pini TaxID=1963835 RepID=A0A212QZV4_9PROT|nr:protoheme IX farnesyltransferase [Arboricoccus pini]
MINIGQHTIPADQAPRDFAPNPQGGILEPTSSLQDFFTLLKPNVMQLVVFTSWVGLYLAPGHIHPLIGFTAILCIAAGAGASAAINNWFDVDIDRRMARTAKRPTAQGRISPENALQTGVVLAVLSVMVMGTGVNWIAAGLLALTIGFYVFVYTMWLKRRTPQNIVVGGAAGAFPPMVGWAAVTGDVSLLPILMFLIIFLWTPAHFWALALYRTGDYGKVGVPMLPVVAGRPTTLNHILVYTLIVVAVSLVPVGSGDLGLIYGACATLLGATFVGYAWRLWRRDSDVIAMRMFRFSILYLFLLFAAMVADRALGGLSWPLL